MKTIHYYKTKAKRAALLDASEGFTYHCLRNASSKRIDAITGEMIAEGFNNSDRDLVSLVWECNLK